MPFIILKCLVTANEIEAGITNSNDPKRCSFVIFRDFEDIEVNEINKKFIEKFIEKNGEEKEYLSNLKEKIKKKLPDANKFYFKVNLLNKIRQIFIILPPIYNFIYIYTRLCSTSVYTLF